MPHSAHKVIGQLRVSSPLLEIKASRTLHILRAERFRKLREGEIEIEAMTVRPNLAEVSKA